MKAKGLHVSWDTDVSSARITAAKQQNLSVFRAFLECPYYGAEYCNPRRESDPEKCQMRMKVGISYQIEKPPLFFSD